MVVQRAQLKNAVRHCPRESGYHMSLWTTKLVRHFIYTYTRFGVEHCWERVRQLLHELGVCLRRLRHRYLKSKPEEQVAFRTGMKEWLAEWPEDCELIFVDAGTVRRHPTLMAQVVSGRGHARGAHGG